MILFNGDLIKFITYNRRRSADIIHYGVCLGSTDLVRNGGINYLNLCNGLEDSVLVGELVSISLVGNIKSVFYHFKTFSSSLDYDRKSELLKECHRLVNEKDNVDITDFTDNEDLKEISSIVNCNPLILSSLVVNYSSIRALCSSRSGYPREPRVLKSSSKVKSGLKMNSGSKLKSKSKVNPNKKEDPSSKEDYSIKVNPSVKEDYSIEVNPRIKVNPSRMENEVSMANPSIGRTTNVGRIDDNKRTTSDKRTASAKRNDNDSNNNIKRNDSNSKNDSQIMSNMSNIFDRFITKYGYLVNLGKSVCDSNPNDNSKPSTHSKPSIHSKPSTPSEYNYHSNPNNHSNPNSNSNSSTRDCNKSITRNSSSSSVC